MACRSASEVALLICRSASDLVLTIAESSVISTVGATSAYKMNWSPTRAMISAGLKTSVGGGAMPPAGGAAMPGDGTPYAGCGGYPGCAYRCCGYAGGGGPYCCPQAARTPSATVTATTRRAARSLTQLAFTPWAGAAQL